MEESYIHSAYSSNLTMMAVAVGGITTKDVRRRLLRNGHKTLQTNNGLEKSGGGMLRKREEEEEGANELTISLSLSLSLSLLLNRKTLR
jgi:hypothetical protein